MKCRGSSAIFFIRGWQAKWANGQMHIKKVKQIMNNQECNIKKTGVISIAKIIYITKTIMIMKKNSLILGNTEGNLITLPLSIQINYNNMINYLCF